MVKALTSYQAESLGYSVRLILQNPNGINDLSKDLEKVEVYPRHVLKPPVIWGIHSNRCAKDKTVRLYHFHNLYALGCYGPKPKYSLCTFHGIGALDSLHGIQRHFVKRGVSRKLAYSAVDERTASYFAKLGCENIEIIPNGLADCPVHRTQNNKAVFNVGFVGVLDDLKGYRFLLDAASLTSMRGLPIHYHFAGELSDCDRRYFDTFISEKKLKDIVHYAGKVPNAGSDFIPNMDVVVLPSRTEGLPVVLIEAIRAGLPLIATNVGGIPSLLIEGYNGCFIERSGNDIAQRIVELASNQELCRAFGNASRQLFLRDFCIQTVAKSYDSLYRRILSGAY